MHTTLTAYDVFALLTDIDECSSNTSECNHYCNNTDGWYFCTCQDGFILGTDKHNCTGEFSTLVPDYRYMCQLSLHLILDSTIILPPYCTLQLKPTVPDYSTLLIGYTLLLMRGDKDGYLNIQSFIFTYSYVHMYHLYSTILHTSLVIQCICCSHMSNGICDIKIHCTLNQSLTDAGALDS